MSTAQFAPKIESKDLNISDLCKDFYTVPDFQREYVWEEENVERLLQDVYDEFYEESGRVTTIGEYFIGSIVVCPADDGTFHLIDGQQRLTTIYLTLCAIRDQLMELNGAPSETLQRQVAATSTDPRTGEDVFRYRLQLQYEDSAGVLETIAARSTPVSDIPETTASVRHIIAAYEAICDFLRVNFGDDVAGVKAFYAAFTLRVKLIRIVTPDITHALKVFETINDRGVGLNAMDLLKNLLFIKTASDDYARLKDRWKRFVATLDECREKPLRFLRYYIHSSFDVKSSKPLLEDEVYRWFVEHTDETRIEHEPLVFVDDLVKQSRAYANFAAGKDAQGEPNRYIRNIALLGGGKARQHFVLLLAGSHLAPPLFTELCRQIENLLFCYLITREQTKSYEPRFARWAGELRRITDAESLREFIQGRIRPEITSRSNLFDFAFAELSQSRIQQYRLRYILAKLTQYVEERAWGNPVYAQLDQYVHRSVHIEHILPQRPSPQVRAAFDKPDEYDNYREKLGNLTLLQGTINSSVSNSTYDLKKPGYRQSNFLLTKSLVERPQVGTATQFNRAVEGLIQFETWNSETIEKRQQMLGSLAREVWQVN
jgi:hypothetical protein